MQDSIDKAGASLVNDELAVGFDARFEYRFVYLQWTGQAVLVMVVILGLAGLLGRGPFSHATAHNADRTVSVDYEPVARYGTETQVTLRIKLPDQRRQVKLTLDTEMLEPMGLQTVEPKPVGSAANNAGITSTFDVSNATGESFIRLHLKPTIVGPVPLRVYVEGLQMVAWTQFVLP